MKSGVRKGIATTFSLLSVVSLFAQHGETSGPNIVMFLIDDLGWNDFGCYGSKFYQTRQLIVWHVPEYFLQTLMQRVR